jgi:ABC-type glycerol-3-phosphate transport system substrate-binding protein
VKSLLLAAGIAPLLSVIGCRLERTQATAVVTVEVAIFEGGYGVEWHRRVAREYERLHPNIRINLWGDPRVDEKLKPRVLRGNPPDVANSLLPIWKLIVAGKLYPLDEALDSRAYDQPLTWRQTLLPGVLSNYRYRGETYAMPTDFGAWVVWYDRRLFRRHGWQPPRTWGELRALCRKIRAAGVAPVAFQGKYPIYAWQTLLNLYLRITTPEKWYALQDLAPGAFTDPDFLRAAALLHDLAVNCHQPGSSAMTHTEAQLEWVNGRAALVFCGLWLRNEMKEAIPPGFEMDCFPVPGVEGGRGEPDAVLGGGGAHYFVFADAPHPREGADFLKFMVSRARARTFTETLGALSPVRDSTRGVPLPSGLEGAVKIVERAPRIYSDRLTSLYLEFAGKELPAQLAALMERKITPDAFGRRLEDAAEKVRRDPDIYKPPPMERDR